MSRSLDAPCLPRQKRTAWIGGDSPISASWNVSRHSKPDVTIRSPGQRRNGCGRFGRSKHAISAAAKDELPRPGHARLRAPTPRRPSSTRFAASIADTRSAILSCAHERERGVGVGSGAASSFPYVQRPLRCREDREALVTVRGQVSFPIRHSCRVRTHRRSTRLARTRGDDRPPRRSPPQESLSSR